MLYCRCKEDFFGYCGASSIDLKPNIYGYVNPIAEYKLKCPKNLTKEYKLNCPDYLPNSIVNPKSEIEKLEFNKVKSKRK